MSESDLWSRVKAGIGGRWEAERIETRGAEGIPDVAWSARQCHGWVELKHVDKDPGPGKILKIRHYTPEQRNWILRHGRAGGRVFMLLRVGTEILLLNHMSAQEVGFRTLDELRTISAVNQDQRAKWVWTDVLEALTV